MNRICASAKVTIRVAQKKIDDFRFWLQHQKIIVWDVSKGLEFFQAEKKFFHVGPKSLKIFGLF